jgi:hypothetical protein
VSAHDPLIVWLLQHAAYHRTLASCQTDVDSFRARQAEAERYEEAARRLSVVPSLIQQAKIPVIDPYEMAMEAARLAREADGLPAVEDPLSEVLSRPEDPPEGEEPARLRDVFEVNGNTGRERRDILRRWFADRTKFMHPRIWWPQNL